jgi:hypothetical protein
MKKILLPAAFILAVLVAACNNSDKKPADGDKKAEADSLMTEVMDGHDVGMAKMDKLATMEKAVQGVLDSIAKLPAKARDAAAPLKAKMESLGQDLKTAKEGMMNWMNEFNMDSAVNNIQERINYLANEKLKVSQVKESILNSLQKADSLLKAKF